MESIWGVCNTVNMSKLEALQMEFPSEHTKQLLIAEGFRAKLWEDIGCCVGAIDGMLVWMDKPSVKVLKGAQVGAKKFYCGRKHKHGMILQAICNHKRQFMDIKIRNPG